MDFVGSSRSGSRARIQSTAAARHRFGRLLADRADDFPLVETGFASKDKHGQYASKCSTFGTCFDTCTLAPAPHRPPITNVGEPGAALVTNLTTQGFINAMNGWTKAELMNVNPWAPGDFGSAGNVADDLIDPVFVPAACP